MTFLLVMLGWAILFSSFGYVTYTMLTERIWQNRININYNNYQQIAKLYAYKPSNKNYYFTSILLAIAFIYIILISNRSELVLYVYLSISSMFITGGSLYVIHSRRTKNKDLTPFDMIYNRVTNSYQNLRDMDLIRKNFTNLKEKFEINNENIEKQINLNVKSDLPLELKKTLNRIDDLVQECDDIINGFDTGLSKKFTEALIFYLKNGRLENINIHQLITVNVDINDLKNEIINEQKATILKHVENVINTKAYLSEKALLDLINDTVNNLDIQISSFMISFIIDHLKNEKAYRTELLKILVDHKVIDHNDITKLIIDQSYDWLLSNPLIKIINQKNHIDISAYLIEKNKHELVLDYLMSLDQEYMSIIQTIVKNVKINNEAMRYYQLFLEITQTSISFDYAQTTKNENIYQSINLYSKNYHAKDISEKLSYINVSKIDQFETTLNELYSIVIDEHKHLFDQTFKLLFVWMNSMNHDQIFDQQKTIRLVSELQKNLLIKELINLDLLLISYILSQNNSIPVIQSTLNILSSFINDYQININSIGELTAKHQFRISHMIVKHLMNPTNNLSVLNIANRIEKDRLLMQKLENYNGNGWK